MKEKLKKFTLTILAVMMAFNGIICFDRGYVVQAADAGTTVNEQDLEDEFNQMDDSSQNWGNDLADVLLGIVLYIPKAMAYAIVGTVRLIVWLISAIDQNSSAGSSATSIESILFNGYKITSIDFFSGIGGTSTMGKLKQNVATWYYSMRNIAIVILLGILLYVGIRMAISTVAEEEAKYKKMFKDWVVSLVLLFVLHYIMIFTIEMNDVLVDLIGTSRPGGTALSTAMETIAGKVWDVRFTVGVGALCVYAILVGMTVIYLFMYIKRMLTVGFLIIIAPLITITYSIDKMGDGRSQALNTWLKEFVFNILIQPFHCIIYMVFVTTAINLLDGRPTLYASVLAVLMLMFTFQAEKIVKKIFNFQSSSLSDAIGSAAAVTAGISFLRDRGNKSAKDNPNVDKMPNMKGQNMFPGSAAGAGAGGAAGTGAGGTAAAAGNGANAGGANAGGASNTGAGNGEGPQATPVSTTGTGAGANTDSSQSKKRSLKNFIGFEAGGGATTRAAKKYLDSSFKLAQMAALGMLGAATGTGKGITAGLYAGSAINKGVTAKMNQRTAKKRTKQNEQAFAGAYKNFQAQSGKSDEEMQTFTQQLMDGTIDEDNLNDNEKEYNSYVKKMTSTYSVLGEDDVEGRMKDTLQRIALPDDDPDRIAPVYGDGEYQAPVQPQQSAPEPEPAPEPAPEVDLWQNIPNTRDEAYEYANNLYGEGKISDDEHARMLGEASQRPGDIDEAYEYANNLWNEGKISDDEHTKMIQEYKNKFEPKK